MVKVGLFVRLHAKKGKEQAVEDFIKGALPLALEETQTVTWYAVKFDESTFGIFDTFNDDAGRQAHLKGKIAAALMEHAADLLETPPSIEMTEILSAK